MPDAEGFTADKQLADTEFAAEGLTIYGGSAIVPSYSIGCGQTNDYAWHHFMNYPRALHPQHPDHQESINTRRPNAAVGDRGEEQLFLSDQGCDEFVPWEETRNQIMKTLQG